MHWTQCDHCGEIAPFNHCLEYNHKLFEVKEIPKCLKCGNPVRPNVFLFEDRLWDMQRYREQEARMQEFMANKDEILVLEIGAGIMIPTVRYISETSITTDSVKQVFLLKA